LQYFGRSTVIPQWLERKDPSRKNQNNYLKTKHPSPNNDATDDSTADRRLVADIPRRDAVVDAFKVRSTLYGVIWLLICVSACLVGVRLVFSIVRSKVSYYTSTERDAMGSDEYHPISHRGANLSRSGGIGYTIVDAIDTMLLMDLHEEYSRVKKWIRDGLTFDRDGQNRCFNTFEVCTAMLTLLGNTDPYHARLQSVSWVAYWRLFI
jgi:hypothetical protein